MKATDRNELIRAMIYDYHTNKLNDKVWMREPSSGYSISKGKLLGCLIAFGLDIEEDEQEITIKTQKSGKTVLRYDFDKF